MNSVANKVNQSAIAFKLPHAYFQTTSKL